MAKSAPMITILIIYNNTNDNITNFNNTRTLPS